MTLKAGPNEAVIRKFDTIGDIFFFFSSFRPDRQWCQISFGPAFSVMTACFQWVELCVYCQCDCRLKDLCHIQYISFG